MLRKIRKIFEGNEEENKTLQEKLSEQLRSECEENGITQQKIFEEMTEEERAVLEKVVGMPYVEATLNLIGIEYGEREQQREYEQLDER